MSPSIQYIKCADIFLLKKCEELAKAPHIYAAKNDIFLADNEFESVNSC